MDWEKVKKIYSQRLKKLFNLVIFIFGFSIILLNFFPKLETIRFRAYFTGGMLFLAFIKNSNKNNINKYLKYTLSIIAILVFSYVIYRYPIITFDGGILTNLDYIVGFVGIMLILIAGIIYSKNLFILVLIFLGYVFLGRIMPLPISHSGFSINRVISHSIYGSQGIFGITMGVCASYIFLFLIFGEFLQKSGLSNFINDISMSLIGNKSGGPAKVAVFASALLGMINGSAVANVATTGMITIPLMKKIGYDKDFAGAVEATASTGGQFCPPIMGAVGFVMAEYLSIPYSKVMFAAIIPAIFYYFGVLVSVHQEANIKNLKGLNKEDLPKFSDVIKERGFLAIPIFVVIGIIVLGYSPLYGSVIGIIATIVVSWFSKENKLYLKDIFEGIVNGTLSAINISISCILIGIIIGIVSLTSLGLNFGNLIMSYSAISNVLGAGILTMIMSTILGMGIPGVAAYVIVASVSAPILINMGVIPIVAHMFCLIYACLSNITPPVAISSYVAAGISGGDEFKTSIQAVKIGITGFIFPFFFLLNPELLIGAVENVSLFTTLRMIITGLFGVFNISCSAEGFLLNRLNNIERLALAIVGLLFVDPNLYTDIAGVLIFIVILIKNRGDSYEKA